MLYIKIGENKYPIEKFSTFQTQLGQTAVRIVGDTPTANGFEIVDDGDNVIADCKEYVYLYREDEKCKEYTKVAEEIIPTQSFATGDFPVNPIQRQISALNKRISDITPYTQTKYGYYGETEKVFYGVPRGVVIVICEVENSISRVDDRVIVKFAERLADTTEITIMVQ